MFGARNPPRIVLAGDQASFTVARIAVRIVGRIAKHADMPIVFRPAHDAIVGYVAPQQISTIAKIDRAFAPSEAGGDTLDRSIANFVFEPAIEHLNARIGVTRPR